METSSKESIFIPCLNEDEDEDRNRNTVRNESGNESGDLDEFEIVTRESHPKNEAVVKRLDEHEIKEENGTKSDEILKHVGVTEFIPGMYVYPLSQLYNTINGWWVDGWIDGWMDGGWVDGWMDGWWVDGWMDGWMVGGWMDRWMDGWWVDGWMDG